MPFPPDESAGYDIGKAWEGKRYFRFYFAIETFHATQTKSRFDR